MHNSILLIVILTKIILFQANETINNNEEKIINIPKEYKFNNLSLDNIKLLRSPLSNEERNNIFQYVKWKDGVNVFKRTIIDKNIYIAEYKDKLSYLTLKNIGYFIDDIISNKMAWEIALLYQNGLIINNSSYLNELYSLYGRVECCKIINNLTLPYLPTENYYENNKLYKLSYYIYVPRDLIKIEIHIKSNGLIGFNKIVIAKGPRNISGWPGPGKELDDYISESKLFKSNFNEILIKISFELIKDDLINLNGMFKSKINAIIWLSKNNDESKYNKVIKSFIDKNINKIDKNIICKIEKRLKNK
jgi:hypothetical protein